MQRTIVLTILLLPGLAQGQPTWAFSSPAQVEGTSDASLSWALVFFEERAQANVIVPDRVSVINHTVLQVQSRLGAHATTYHNLPPQQSTAAPGDMELRFTGWSTLFIAAEDLRITTGQARGEVNALHSGQLPAREILQSDPPEGTFRGGLHQIGDEAGLWLRDRNGLSFQLQATGVHTMEFHLASITCTNQDCPDGGTVTGHEDASMLVASRSYIRLEGALGVLEAQGVMYGYVGGGPSIDVSIDGTTRLPLATAIDLCPECVDPDMRTVDLEGNTSLLGMANHGNGRLHATVAGSIDSARLDEQVTDPETLLTRAGLTVSAAAAAMGVAAILWKTRALLHLAALFTRLTGSNALLHPGRRAIYDVIRQEPGIHLRGLIRQVGLASGTTRHHLGVLQRSQLILARPHARTLCFFPNRMKYRSRSIVPQSPSAPELQRLHNFVARNPGAMQAHIIAAADAWGWSRSTTQRRLEQLLRAGRVRRQKQGRAALYYSSGRQVEATMLNVAAMATSP